MNWLRKVWTSYFFDPEECGITTQVAFGNLMTALIALAVLAFAIGAAIVHGVH
jgi:hypothetical protein